MPLDLGNLKDIINNITADVQNELPDLDPSIVGSAIKAIVETLGARSFDNRQLIAQVLQQFFPQTSIDDFLELWAGISGLTRNAATIATGFLTATGNIGTDIPASTLLNTQSNVILETQATATISNISTSITTLTRSGNIVTAVCASDHKLASGVNANMAGAVETEYNGIFEVTVIDSLTFTYFITTSPSTPATGTIFVDFDGVELSVETQDVGLNQNVGAGNIATFSSPIAGADVSAFVRSDGIEGGTDVETDDDLRVRILEEFAEIKSLFNVAFIVSTAKTVSGVTRVFVKEITPGIGDTTVYFMRDGDTNPIPSGIDITNVNDLLQEIRPANMQESDFDILAPTAIPVDITLSSLDPDTPTMRDNIEAVLAEFFTFQVDFEEDVLIDRIKSALFNAQDTETGDFLQSFSLDVPAIDVAILSGEIGVLGAITIS